MATSLAAQLSEIAANSEQSLNLKAQKAKHSKSLIFEPRIASSQNFETIYSLCYEGFQELCLLDGRFLEFQNDIFSEQSQEKDRSQMTAMQNVELDRRLEIFLGLVSRKLRLSPAIKALEWLVRKFRIHEYNTSITILTFLPYHTLPIFKALMSILPTKIDNAFRFLQPYIRSITSPPRSVIVQAAIKNLQFASIFNNYILSMTKMRHDYPSLISFWAGVTTEATACMLDRAGSGRKTVQLQNEQDVIIKLLPILKQGLTCKDIPNLRLACYMLLSVIASKVNLNDKLLTSMMEAVVLGWTNDTAMPCMVCLALIAQRRGVKKITKKIIKHLTKDQSFMDIMIKISTQQRVDRLANGLCLALIERLRKGGESNDLSLLKQIIENNLLIKSQVMNIVKSLVLFAYQINESRHESRSCLADLLVVLSGFSGPTGSVIRTAISETKIDIDDLELRLQTSIRPWMKLDKTSDEKMEPLHNTPSKSTPKITTLLEQLPKKLDAELSFLSLESSQIYSQLYHVFLLCNSNSEDLTKFDETPILNKSIASKIPHYISFYMRTWSTSSLVSIRVSALQMVTLFLKSNLSEVDFQVVIPYIITALGDPSTKVRCSAVQLLSALKDLYLPSTNLKEKKAFLLWGKNEIYGEINSEDLSWMPTEIAARVVTEILVPAAEECKLDQKHIYHVFHKCLNRHGSQKSRDELSDQLSQSSRTMIMNFLASHITHTPFVTVKLRLLESTNQVRSIGGFKRSKFLLPALKNWTSLTQSEVSRLCQEEKLDVFTAEEQFIMIVTAKDEEGFKFLLSLIQGRICNQRPLLEKATLKQLKSLWSSLSRSHKLLTAKVLLIASEPSSSDLENDLKPSAGASELLHEIPLSTKILELFLSELPTAEILSDVAPASKKRRTCHGEVSIGQTMDSVSLPIMIWRLTFVLQLVDDSEPGKHPDLLEPLFNVLAQLQHLKSLLTSELAYLQGLVLKSIFSILKTYETNQSYNINFSAIRADLLADCVQKTTSLQVQNSALLVISSLAHIAPQLVLHSVMPIFTFMGSSILQQNDGYSAHVINQTIREVIPPLIASLRDGSENPITGAAELLLSFVAAYEHIPCHRRKEIFLSLVQTLGPEDFLFAILAMLAHKYVLSIGVKNFAIEIFGNFSVEIRLQTAVKFIDLISDILNPKSKFSPILLNTIDETGKLSSQTAQIELTIISHLLSEKKLIVQIGNILAQDDMDAARVRELYSTLMEKTLALSDDVKEQKSLHVICGNVLERILALLSTSEFIKSVEDLLDKPNEFLRRKILRSLLVRIENEKSSDALSRVALLGFLPQLTAIIRDSRDTQYKQTAIICVEKISEKYGKKDIEAVVAAVETISGSYCLGQLDYQLRIMALMCLTSLVNVLREGIIAVLPIAIPKALEYLKESVRIEARFQTLHRACYSFLSALARHLSYMISVNQLEELLEISNMSAQATLDNETTDCRIQCLFLVAKQVNHNNLFSCLQQSLSRVISFGPLVLRENLSILSIAVDYHTKSIITDNSSTLAKIFQNAFDFRRQIQSFPNEYSIKHTVDEIESDVNEIAIKMVFKLNDTTFRPMFINLVDWVTRELQEDKVGKLLREQSFYSFTTVFFDNLKSIVTSYASYLIENAVEVIKSVDTSDEFSKTLWIRVIQTLKKCFEYDQDDFWQSPSHFKAVAPELCAQFKHGTSLPLVQELVPAIVELASAADSPDHHKEINLLILNHMRSENANIRFSAVICEQKLTDKLGEEWLSMLPEMLPFISELQEDDDELVEKETHHWILKIEEVLGESLDSMLQ